MLVGRAVATACTAALLTGAQVKPSITSLYTIFTNPLFWLLDFSNLVDVNAYFCCHPASIQSVGDRRSFELCVNNLFWISAILRGGHGVPPLQMTRVSSITYAPAALFFCACSCCMYCLIAAICPGARCSFHSSNRFATFSRFASMVGS